MYRVAAFEQLPKEAQEAVIYLCYMELNKTRSQLYDMYNLTPTTLRAIMKRVQAVVVAMADKDNYLYIICQLYRSSFKSIEVEFETVSGDELKAC